MATQPNSSTNDLKLGDPATIPVTNPRNVTSVYSNHFGVSATMTDFTIHFLEVGQTPGPTGSVPMQEIRASVTLPMAAADGLVQVMAQIAAQHEQAQRQAEKMKASAKK